MPFTLRTSYWWFVSVIATAQVGCESKPDEPQVRVVATNSAPAGSIKAMATVPRHPHEYVVDGKTVLSRRDLILREYFAAIFAALGKDEKVRKQYKQEFVSALAEAANKETRSGATDSVPTTQVEPGAALIMMDLSRLVRDQTSESKPATGNASEGTLRHTQGNTVVYMPADYYLRLANASFRKAAPSTEQQIINQLSQGGLGHAGGDDPVLKVLNDSFASGDTDHLNYVFDFIDNAYDALNYARQNDLQRQYYNTHLGAYGDAVLLGPAARGAPVSSPRPAPPGSSVVTLAPDGKPFGAGAAQESADNPYVSTDAKNNVVSGTCRELVEYIAKRGVYSPRSDNRKATHIPTQAGNTVANVARTPPKRDKGSAKAEGTELCWHESLDFSTFSIDVASYQLTWKPYFAECAAEAKRWNAAVVAHERRHQNDFKGVERTMRSSGLEREIRVCAKTEEQLYAKINPARTLAHEAFIASVHKKLVTAREENHERYGKSEPVDCSCEQGLKPRSEPGEGAHVLYAAPGEAAMSHAARPQSVKQTVIILGKVK